MPWTVARIVVDTVWFLALALLMGRLLVGLAFGAVLVTRPRDRRRWIRWLAASRAVGATVYPALGALVATALVWHLAGMRAPIWRPPGAFGLLTWLTLAVATAVIAVAVRADRLHAAGRLHRAHRLGRWSGRAAPAPCLGGAALVVLSTAGGARPGWPAAIGGAVALLTAGWIVTLGGLSGKPRPAGRVAGCLLLVGIATWVAGGWLAG